MNAAAESLPRVPWRRAPLVLLLCAAAVAILSWPWLATASTHVLDHWDPPFHAWKLAYAAKAILAGHVLPPDGNTNLYYPNSGAFYYEALHWPQAVFAAPLLAAGLGEVATYHVTLLFFWALSGVFFWAFLRALGLGGAAATLGALFYTVSPWRMSYLPEFNMQLVFGLPLLLFALVRFFQRPGFRYALLGAVAWWLQAVSELYQAVFILMAIPFLALPLFARDPALLRSVRRFWAPLAAAAALCAALALPMLWPYAETLDDGTLTRSLSEMNRHALQPFSYLLPWGRFRLLPKPVTGFDEMSVYPTLALLAASAAGALALWRRRSRRSRRLALASLAAPTLAAAMLFAWHFGALDEGGARGATWSLAAVVAISPVFLLAGRNRSVRAAVGAGLVAAALFGLTMSLGPVVLDKASGIHAPNILFLAVHKLIPALAGFRVVSRFSLFPFAVLCAAAAWGVEEAGRILRGRPAALRAAAGAAFVAAFLVECVPSRAVLSVRPIRDVSGSTVLAALDARKEPYVLAVVPMGRRSLDSEHMLAIERDDRLGVWAWGGTYPPWTKAVGKALQPSAGCDPEPAAELLRQSWPEVLVLEDRRPFPTVEPCDWPGWFGPLAETVLEDPDFRLLRLVPDAEPRPEHVRLVRRDFALASPVARFSLAAPDGPARVWLDLNGMAIGCWDVGPEPRECAVPINPMLLLPRLPERFRFHAEGDAPFRLASFRLGGEGAVPEAPVDPDEASASGLRWLFVRRSLPPGATPVDVRYPCGISLVGVERLEDDPDGAYLRLRLWLAPAPGTRHAPNVSLSPGFARGDSVVFQAPTALSHSVPEIPWTFLSDNHLLLPANVILPCPDLLRPGETVGLSLDVKSPSGRRINGRDADGRKVRHAMLGLDVTVPGTQAPAAEKTP